MKAEGSGVEVGVREETLGGGGDAFQRIQSHGCGRALYDAKIIVEVRGSGGEERLKLSKHEGEHQQRGASASDERGAAKSVGGS